MYQKLPFVIINQFLIIPQMINKMKETPSVGRYKPKYEFVDKRPPAFVYRENITIIKRPMAINK